MTGGYKMFCTKIYFCLSGLTNSFQDFFYFLLEFFGFRLSREHQYFVETIFSEEPVFCIALEYPANIMSGGSGL